MAHEVETHHGSHPGSGVYIKIAIILAVLTAAEVAVFYLDITSWLMTMILLALALAKFVLVVGYFMHLKMDDRRFSLLFFFPLIVMVSLAVALMALFHNLTR